MADKDSERRDAVNWAARQLQDHLKQTTRSDNVQLRVAEKIVERSMTEKDNRENDK